MSNDGFGDGRCCKVATGRGGALTMVASNPFFNSLGVYYNYVTQFCGFPRSHHAGKTTGLAAFGDPSTTLKMFQSLIGWDEGRGRYLNHGRVFRNCLRDLCARLDGVSREDAAAGVQRHFEDVLAAMVRHWVSQTGLRRVALVGGVHANVKVNQRLAALPDVERVFVFPNMGDGGLALGAALLAARGSNGGGTVRRLGDVYLGPCYSESKTADALRTRGLAFDRPKDLAVEIAKELAADRIVARFDGPSCIPPPGPT